MAGEGTTAAALLPFSALEWWAGETEMGEREWEREGVRERAAFSATPTTAWAQCWRTVATWWPWPMPDRPRCRPSRASLRPEEQTETQFSSLQISQTIQWFDQLISPIRRATRVLQLCLKKFGQNLNGLQTKIPQRWLHANRNAVYDSQFLEIQNNIKLIFVSLVWLI